MSSHISIRQHTEDGMTFDSSIILDDDNHVLITINGHQIALDDARCLCLLKMLQNWKEKRFEIKECHKICDECYNCLRSGQCHWDSDRKCMVYEDVRE